MSDTECASGQCEAVILRANMATQKVCCAKACGECGACIDTGFECFPVNFGDDPDSCPGGKTCSGMRCLDVDVDRLFVDQPLTRKMAAANLFQTFTMEGSGRLVEIRVTTDCESLLLYSVGADPKPEGAFRAQSAGPENTSGLPGGRTPTKAFVLSPPVTVTAGERLGFELTQTGCQYEAVDSAYANGQVFLRNTTNDSWLTEDAQQNFRFESIVER